MIGKTSTHPSHKLRLYKGLIFCNNCGNFTQGKFLKNLNQSCEAEKSHGKAAKKRISEGKLPQGVDQWPSENPTSPFYTTIKIPTKGLTQMKVEQHIQELARACPPSPIPTQTESSPPENPPTLQAESIATPPPQPFSPNPLEVNPS